jgi:hypothetical protein
MELHRRAPVGTGAVVTRTNSYEGPVRVPANVNTHVPVRVEPVPAHPRSAPVIVDDDSPDSEESDSADDSVANIAQWIELHDIATR